MGKRREDKNKEFKIESNSPDMFFQAFGNKDYLDRIQPFLDEIKKIVGASVKANEEIKLKSIEEKENKENSDIEDMSNDDSKNYIRKYKGTPKKNEIKVNPKEIIKKIKEKKKDENYVPFTGFTISQ